MRKLFPVILFLDTNPFAIAFCNENPVLKNFDEILQYLFKWLLLSFLSTLISLKIHFILLHES